MAVYSRYQTDMRCPETGLPLGLFRAAGELEDQRVFDAADYRRAREVLDWFSVHLRSPNIRRRYRRSLFWFCGCPMWFSFRALDLVDILRDYGVQVREQRTDRPGMIIYRDSDQVCAVPSTELQHDLRDFLQIF